MSAEVLEVDGEKIVIEKQEEDDAHSEHSGSVTWALDPTPSSPPTHTFLNTWGFDPNNPPTHTHKHCPTAWSDRTRDGDGHPEHSEHPSPPLSPHCTASPA